MLPSVSPRKPRRSLALLLALLLTSHTVPVLAQNSTQVTTSLNLSTPTPSATFSWSSPLLGSMSFPVKRRVIGSGSAWETRGTVTPPTSTFTDSITPGVIYEYEFPRTIVPVTVDPPVVHSRGKLILVVESSTASALPTEIKQLETDLAGDGWTVLRLDYARNGTGTPGGLKAEIKTLYDQDTANTKALYLFGHLPILKSGFFDPDGHGNRAHATDGYYADFTGTWTGTFNSPTSSKAGQNLYPAPLQLMVGRTDLANMKAFHKLEMAQLQDYIHKSHTYRTGQRTELPWRSLASHSTLWQESNWITALMGGPAHMTYASMHDTLKTYPHVFGSDFGVESGTNARYTGQAHKMIFGINHGSYKQEWDKSNNPMRALMAQPDWGLTCWWGGRPSWQVHQMAVGHPVGFSALTSVNLSTTTMVTGNLMGDPTLRMNPVIPPSQVTVARQAGGVVLGWVASPETDITGYHVYRSAQRLGPFTCLTTASPVTGTTFTDASAPSGALYYQVKTLKSIVRPSVRYPNLSQGAFAYLRADGSSNQLPIAHAGTTSVDANHYGQVSFAGFDWDGESFTSIIIKNPGAGKLRNNGKQIVYQPKAGFVGTDTVNFRISDGLVTSEVKTLTIQVAPSQTLLAWEFNNVTAANTPQNLNSTANATGISTSAITTGSFPGLTLTTNHTTRLDDGISLTGIASGAKNSQCYLEWTVTPQASQSMDLDRLALGLWSEGTAVLNAELHWSTNNFATSKPVSIGTGTIMTVRDTAAANYCGVPYVANLAHVAALQDCPFPVTFRLYLWHTGTGTAAGIGKLGATSNDLAITGYVGAQSTFAAWTTQVDWQGGDSGYDGDADQDNLTNKVEFALGTNPVKPDPAYHHPQIVKSGGTPYLAVASTRRIAERGLLTLTASEDLVEWNAVTPNGQDLIEEVVDPDVHGDGEIERVLYKLPISNGVDKRYLRFEVVDEAR